MNTRPDQPLRLGTRRSKLAMSQSGHVADAVRAVTGRAVELVEITTFGDVSREHLSQIGGTGVFVTALRDALLRGEGDEHLLLLEHPSVFTLGRNADTGDVVAGAEWLDRRGVEVHEADRGGQATYHGPGQLVGYPIVDLKPDRRDVRRYVRDLEEVLIRTLAEYGVVGEPALSPRPVGVWVGDSKIASIGIHLRHWVTTHGFALNVTTDLSFFGGIVACGMPSAPMTSIEERTGARPELDAVASRVSHHFCEVFGRVSAPLAEESVSR
jgi:lipoyl(octanoyl) transferase